MEILDPVHGHIQVSEEEKKLIDSPYIQRLRHVKQLTAADNIYPGGGHTRFLHSIGSMNIGTMISDHLFSNDPHTRQLIRLCLLFHDCGHGIGSHAYDETVYSRIYPTHKKGHDQHRFKIIQSPHIKNIIENECNVKIQEIFDVWNCKNKIIHEVCQGQLGADRLDFTVRDAYFCGTSHFNSISLSRIINNSYVFHGKVCYSLKIKDDVLLALTSRLNMYKNVYYHHTVTAAQILFKKMLSNACDGLNLIERTKNIEEFKNINDYIIGEIICWNGNNDKMKIAQECAKNLLNRKLPKIVWEKVVPSGNENNEKVLKIQNEKIKEYVCDNEEYVCDNTHLKYIDTDNIFFINTHIDSPSPLSLSSLLDECTQYNIKNFSIYRIYKM